MEIKFFENSNFAQAGVYKKNTKSILTHGVWLSLSIYNVDKVLQILDCNFNQTK
jgi:hypothetical protein